ncbi:MAG: DUF1385 domain-containing protein [Candidatus Krumholzibacteria bacterium]|nr:DUF1385 domain-containing protein [Candidatus Krumholzibacteria bacterium]
MSSREARKHLHVGGQAVIEGVMMRTPMRIATAVRTPKGEIVIKSEFFTSLTRRYRALGLPIIRGAIALVETFVIAVKSLSFSAEQASAEDSEGKKKDSPKGVSRFHMAVTVVAAAALGFLIFFFIPLVITERIGLKSGILFNLVDGIFRLAFIFLYILLVARWKEMQRVFEYHGAEHKTIFAFEEEGLITPEAIFKYPRMHPRCSTSFLLIVVLVSIILFIVLGKPESIVDRVVRFSFIPVIGGVSYEALKLSAKPRVKRYLGFMLWPGLFLQRYTTREPSRDQIEVAVAALNASLGDKLLEN